MASALIITEAGLDEMIAADQSGTDKVEIVACGFGSGRYTPTADMTELSDEFKVLDTVSGGAVSGSVVHIEVTDGSDDAYTVYEAGLYSASGTLIAVVSQESPLLTKAAASTAFIAFDIKLDNLSADVIELGDTTYINPPATETVAGVAEIATQAEVNAGADDSRIVTPLKLVSWIAAKLSPYLKKSSLLDLTYPVGAIYISTVSTSPATLFGGGTWERITGRFLLAGTNTGTYAAGTTGGSETVTLAASQIPSHKHTVTVADGGAIAARTLTAANAGAQAAKTVTTSSAGKIDARTLTAASNGAHTHDVTTQNGGAIAARTLTAASAGAHTHTRGTMEITGTAPNIPLGRERDPSGTGALSETVTGSGNDPTGSGRLMSVSLKASDRWTGATSSAGAHTHDVSFGAVSAHSHTGTAASGGAHTHSVSFAQVAAHTHTVAIDAVAAHTHSVSFGAVAAHGHSAACANTGGGEAHSNMPPYLAVYVWKRTA